MQDWSSWVLLMCAFFPALLAVVKLLSLPPETWVAAKAAAKKILNFLSMVGVFLSLVAWAFMWGSEESLSRWDVLFVVVISAEFTLWAAFAFTSWAAARQDERIKALEAKLAELEDANCEND